MNFPKVLIIGVAFRPNSGEGITLFNLFKKWPSDRLFFAASDDYLKQSKNIKNYSSYCLGDKENKIKWPLSKFYKNGKSGVYNTKYNKVENTISIRKINTVRKKIIKAIHLLGLYNFFINLKVSTDFHNWVDTIKPDIIYIHPNSYQWLKFVYQINNLTKIPIVLHIMDDTIDSINSKGLLKKYWDKKLYNYFKSVLKSSPYHFCISDKMTEVYSEKFNYEFRTYCNTVIPNNWKVIPKNNFDRLDEMTIIYAGRIGLDLEKIIIEIAKVTKEMTYKINFKIASSAYSHKFVNEINNCENCKLVSPIYYEGMPDFLSQADILLIPLGFSKQSNMFSWLSMPTKTFEYLSTNIPLLVVAPENTALVDLVRKNECAYICTSYDKKEIIQIISDIVTDKTKRKLYQENALKLVNNRFSDTTMGKNFISDIEEISKMRNNENTSYR